MRKKLLLIGSAITLFYLSADAQRTCGTGNPGPEFEQWIEQKMAEMQASRSAAVVYNIPVIVHIIHNGEAVGSGTNLSVAQIQSQIDVLNEDFRKLNADITSVPSVWTSTAADCEINFCMAVVDPQGNTLATPGINRINRNTMGWTAPPYSMSYVDNTIKPATIWNPNNYLNIWVMNLSGGLLGYATFPAGSTLTGLSAPYGGPTDDGVVCLYNAFGRTGNVAAPYNKGRTATHEIGHWLGLRHIWGDSNCGNDYCSDTPLHNTANYGCPTYPHASTCTGAPTEMTMNYMDYTDDACMYMFTNNQKTRVQTCMANGTYRSTLNNSPACQSTSIALDAGVLNVTSPTGTICSSTFTPTVTIRNYGTSTLTSATINYRIDAGPISTFSWTGSLATNATAVVNLPSMTTTAGSHTFTAYTSNPNSGNDGNSGNDSNTSSFSVVSSGQSLPFSEGFEGTTFVPTGWVLSNPDNSTTWARTTLAAKTGVASAFMDNFDYQTGSGQVDHITTPGLNLSSASSPSLSFQVAYRMYTDPSSSTSYSDTLKVQISTDCGATWTTLYNKYSTTLATVTPTFSTTEFVPTANQWRLETISLTSYATSSNAMIRFRHTSDYENNLYLDDINITSVTGITAEQFQDMVSVFPNPTNGQININLGLAEAGDIQIRVFNTLGEQVALIRENNSVGGSYSFDLSDRANGIYFVELSTAFGKTTKKIILNR
jgi:hypothetical protein